MLLLLQTVKFLTVTVEVAKMVLSFLQERGRKQSDNNAYPL